MTISAIFKSTIPSFSYVLKNGMTAVFVGGKFITDNENIIQELAAEVGSKGRHSSKHPYIFVDEDECEIDSEAPTPIELLKAQLREEILAEEAAKRARALDANANVSTSSADQASFVASLGNSNTIAQAGAAESTGDMSAASATMGVAAKLAALTSKS